MRTEIENTTLFKFEVNQVFINDNGSEDHFPLDEVDYFSWSDNLDGKLKEFNDFKLKSDDVDVADGIEKTLYAVQFPRKEYLKLENTDYLHDAIMEHCNYSMTEIKNDYKSWSDLYDEEENEKVCCL
jgi:hypothetical protein